MVSLFELSTQRPLWNHLTTGIHSLDETLSLQSDGIYDFQSVPNNSAMYAVVCNLIVSHLQAGDWQEVLMIETLNPFPWEMLRNFPGFKTDWLDQNRIYSYTVTSFPELFSFFSFDTVKSTRAGSILAIITNFHDLLEQYRLQISATYEEILLKHQIDKNAELLKNLERFEAEGLALIHLPTIPNDSALRRQHPILKGQKHIGELFKFIGEFSYRYSALVALLGHLEPQYKSFTKRKSAPGMDVSQTQAPLSQPNSSMTSVNLDRRLVLMPAAFGKQNNLDDRNSNNDVLNESKLAARLIFYNDWFYNSPMFMSKRRPPLPKERYLVPVVKHSSLNTVANIHEPIFFDFRHNYDIEDSDADEGLLIDLLAQQTDDMSALVQESLFSTQTMPRAVSTQISTALSSSPISRAVRLADSALVSEAEICDSHDQLVIDGSDVELTGTLLEDLGD